MTHYYLDRNNGAYNNGGLSVPDAWDGFLKAMNEVKDGDTIHVRNGNYNERVVPSVDDLEIVAYPGHSPIVDGLGIDLQWDEGVVEIRGRRKIIWDGIGVKNSEYVGILTDDGSYDIAVKNVHALDCVSSGLWFRKSFNVSAIGNELENCCIGPSSQEGIMIHTTDGFEIGHNHLHHFAPTGNGGEGIDAKKGCKNGKIYKNKIHDIVNIAIYLDAAEEPQFDIDVYENEVFDTPASSIAIASEKGAIHKHIRVFRNRCYRTGGIVIGNWPDGMEHPADDIQIYKNTLYRCGYDGAWIFGSGILHQNPYAVNVAIRDNVVVDCKYGQIVVWNEPGNQPTALTENNLVYPFRGAGGEVHGEIEIEPQFADPDAGDLRLIPFPLLDEVGAYSTDES